VARQQDFVAVLILWAAVYLVEDRPIDKRYQIDKIYQNDKM